MATTKRRIHSKGDFRQEEAVAGEAGIYPGMLLKLNSSGQVVKHSTAGGVLGDEVLVAIEDVLQGKTVATVYASGSIVSYIIPQKGSVVNMLIADEQDIAIADKIISNGDGKLKETTGTPAATIGVAEEACDLTGSASDDTLCSVRIS